MPIIITSAVCRYCHTVFSAKTLTEAWKKAYECEQLGKPLYKYSTRQTLIYKDILKVTVLTRDCRFEDNKHIPIYHVKVIIVLDGVKESLYPAAWIGKIFEKVSEGDLTPVLTS